MSKEAAERFVKAWEAKDPEVARALEAQDKTDLDVQALAEIACGIGFEVSEQELAEQFELRRSRILSKIDAADVSDDDLEQVAGGR
ncbi:MAG: Nif11-like leader peptide family RiPP precursor, partial [Atopobiaceae bacterium]|nr:Nif11-like leader peptide family RiPP precursor [Atopobiaceae bacterium]